MIQKNSLLTPLDKSFIKYVQVFHLYFGGKRKVSTSGFFFKSSIKKIKKYSTFKKGFKTNGIIILLKAINYKNDGINFKFKINSCILLKKRLTPRGKEIFGPSIFSIKRKKFINSFVGIL